MPISRETSKTTKSERTCQRILDAASKLILERGGQDFQMAEIAELCDMSKGSLYYYFSDRDAIVQEIFTRVSNEFAERLEKAVARSTSAEMTLRMLFLTLCEAVRDNGLFAIAMATELHHSSPDMLPELQARYERIAHLVAVQIERAKGEGLVRPELDSSLAADVVCGGALFGAARTVRAQGEAFDAECTANAFYDVMLDGLGIREVPAA